jgi:hypothetical protein
MDTQISGDGGRFEAKRVLSTSGPEVLRSFLPPPEQGASPLSWYYQIEGRFLELSKQIPDPARWVELLRAVGEALQDPGWAGEFRGHVSGADAEWASLGSRLRRRVESGILRAEVAIHTSNLQEVIGERDLPKIALALKASEEFLDHLCHERGLRLDGAPLTKERLIEAPYRVERGDLELPGVGNIACYELGAFSRIVRTGRFLQSLLPAIPPFDEAQYERDRAEVGAKGAGLLHLTRFFAAIAPQVQELGIGLNVPAFTTIGCQSYLDHRNGGEIGAEIRRVHSWIAGREVMVRSSARFAEDGEHLGAGIYESVLLRANATPTDLYAAVRAIYLSADLQKAKDYRAERGVSDEEMGIVIQEYQEGVGGYVNTVRSRVPEIADVVFESRHIPFFTPGIRQQITEGDREQFVMNRGAVQERFAAFDLDRTYGFHLPPDIAQTRHHNHAAEILRVAILVELGRGRPVQVEFNFVDHVWNVVQARALPSRWITGAGVEFPPTEDYLWRAQSLGVCDEVLPILSPYRDNRSERGVVIVGSSQYTSESPEWLETVFPKEGAVLMLASSRNTGGHIETRCLERGLVIVTGESVPRDAGDNYLRRMDEAYGAEVMTRIGPSMFSNGGGGLMPNHRLGALRIVSNGTEARVYRAELPATAEPS